MAGRRGGGAGLGHGTHFAGLKATWLKPALRVCGKTSQVTRRKPTQPGQAFGIYRY